MSDFGCRISDDCGQAVVSEAMPVVPFAVHKTGRRPQITRNPKSEIRHPSCPCAFTNAYYTIENYVSNSRLAGCVMVSLRTPLYALLSTSDQFSLCLCFDCSTCRRADRLRVR